MSVSCVASEKDPVSDAKALGDTLTNLKTLLSVEAIGHTIVITPDTLSTIHKCDMTACKVAESVVQLSVSVLELCLRGLCVA